MLSLDTALPILSHGPSKGNHWLEDLLSSKCLKQYIICWMTGKEMHADMLPVPKVMDGIHYMARRIIFVQHWVSRLPGFSQNTSILFQYLRRMRDGWKVGARAQQAVC